MKGKPLPPQALAKRNLLSPLMWWWGQKGWEELMEEPAGGLNNTSNGWSWWNWAPWSLRDVHATLQTASRGRVQSRLASTPPRLPSQGFSVLNINVWLVHLLLSHCQLSFRMCPESSSCGQTPTVVPTVPSEVH